MAARAKAAAGNGARVVALAEGDEDGIGSGLLMWGQAGVYNAVDDRLAIAALCDSAIGVVRPARASAGTGLNVVVQAGWLAIATCDDGTNAVVGARQTHTLAATAGSVGAARRDHIWCDTDPDGGTWALRIIPESDTLYRSGVSLGVINVPAGANLASQFTFSQMVPTLGRHADMSTIGNPTNGRVAMNIPYPIAPYQQQAHNLFKVHVWGGGQMGSRVAVLFFTGNIPSAPIVRIDTSGWMTPGSSFGWDGELQYHVNDVGDRMRTSLRVTVTRWSAAGAQDGAAVPSQSITATRSTGADAGVSRQWGEITLQAWWGQSAAAAPGQNIQANGSTYDTYQAYRFH
jgi:hypothetical protein